MTYIAPTESAKQIRAELKATMGLTQRDVSVRSSSGSIRVKVMNPAADIDRIESIANQHSHVRRCEYSGEILAGGNVFVTVDWDWDVSKAARAAFVPYLNAMANTGRQIEPFHGEKLTAPIGSPAFCEFWIDSEHHEGRNRMSAEGAALWLYTRAARLGVKPRLPYITKAAA